MALSTFPTDMSAAAGAVLASAEKFRAIQSQGGDLTWRLLEDAQNSLRSAKLTTIKALTEGMKAPQASEAFMAGMGGPVTLVEFQQALGAVEIAASAWNDNLVTFLAGLSASDLIGMQSQDAGFPTETRHIVRPAFIPGATAAPLRQSRELANLIAAFETVGA
jgi:hypothetical protein